MSYLDFKQKNETLVEKILEQGQKLRNSMVQSILQNDPLNTEIIHNKHFNTPVCSTTTLPEKKASNTNILEAFLNGDYLTKDEEETALNTIRTMPISDVCKTTERTFMSKCSCATCNAYNHNNLKCDLRRIQQPKESKCLSNYIKDKNWDSNLIIKYADSLKVILQSIHLNNLGNKKVNHGVNKTQLNFSGNETFFVEYDIPEIFCKDVPKSRSKTNSGLDNINHVKVCARRTSEVIYLKQIFTHEICNLYDCNLEEHHITFFVHHKSRGQKNSTLLGIVKFNLGLFEISKNFSCCKTLPIHLNEESPIIIGTLKLTLQLGCGKIYFGQEFVDAVLNQKQLSDQPDSEEEPNEVEINFVTKQLSKRSDNSEVNKNNKLSFITENKFSPPYLPVTKSAYFSKNKNEVSKSSAPTEKTETIQKVNKNLEEELLVGFLYLSEAQFLNVCPNSYILCQPFCQEETSCSKVVFNSANPLYNFCQTVPLLYEESILLKLRENLMVIEFWEKCDQTDSLFGVTRLSLHQFYLAYRNVVILQHLKRNKLPVIGTDWWEPIYSSETNELVGQVQVLTALGTEDQIRNLELERGFKNDIVKAKFPTSTKALGTANNLKVTHSSSYFGDKVKVVKKQPKIVFDKSVNTSRVHISSSKESFKGLKAEKPRKIDIGVQSDMDLEMDPKSSATSASEIKDMLGLFMKQLIEQKPMRVESSMNTEMPMSSGLSTQIPPRVEPNPAIQIGKISDLSESTHIPPRVEPNPATQIRKISDLSKSSGLSTQIPPRMELNPTTQIRKTSDLLESLQAALTLDKNPPKIIQKTPSFSAQILVKGANHLPGRKKVKSRSKRSKGKSPKQEENLLPSTYVTFETMPGDPLRITEVVTKCTAPQWNYKCNVSLPKDYLTDGQKRLIFKVWRKSTNAALQPNMQTDLVLGFAAVDLSVLLAGLPNIQGWFNIIDFTGKCVGQINIHIIPLEKLIKENCSNKPTSDDIEVVDLNLPSTELAESDDNAECNELLSRALKRKFTELDEITQRLRLRLSQVVSEDSEGSNDEIAEEFEKDINNICIEEDFDLINFEEEARKLNITQNTQKSESQNNLKGSDVLYASGEEEHIQQAVGELSNGENLQSEHSEILSNKDETDDTSESSSKSSFMDKNILQGKQRIDSLLEKLSLINAETTQPFSSRYVSGCSVSNEPSDAQDILKNLDETSRPNITAGAGYDPIMLQQLYGGSKSMLSKSFGNLSEGHSKINLDSPGSSGTSIITNFSDCRPVPDGQGTNSDN